MNEEPTKELPDRSSFEDLVIARFDSIDARFDSIDTRFDTVDARLDKLESRAYDTKPIWERALAAIMDMGLEMGEVKGKVAVIETKVGVIETRVGVIETKVELLGNEIGVIKTDHRSIRNELVDMRRELKHHVSERLDLILKFLLEDREDIRDAEARIRELESKFA
jgi:predicted  nucleic acid-binding Zn-ribbon protein